MKRNTRPMPFDKSLDGDKPARQALAGTRLNSFARFPESLSLLYDSRNASHMKEVRRSFNEVVGKIVGRKVNYDVFIAGTDIDVAALDPDSPLVELYDEDRVYDALPPNMVRSVMTRGVTLSVPVWKMGEKGAVPVDGRQRTKWGRAANLAMMLLGTPDAELHKIRCTVEYGTEKEMGDIAILANEHRIENSPVVKARKAARLSNRGRSPEEIADLFDVTPETVERWLQFATTDKAVQMAAFDGTLTMTEAAGLADRPIDEQRKAVQETTSALLENGGKKRRKAPAQLTKPRIAKLAHRDELSDESRTLLRLVAGEITIEAACRKVAGLKKALEATKAKKQKK